MPASTLLSGGVRDHDGFMAEVGVLLVDDQAPFREAARAVLERVKGFELVAEADSGEQALEMVGQANPDLVLMDINMGGISGIEAARLITRAHPHVLVILLSTYLVEDLPPDVRTSGAAAYLHKEDLSGRVLRRLWDEGGDPQFQRPQPDHST